MPKIRVLIVDDAVVIRRLLTDVLGGDSKLEVVGTAANGRIALAKIRQLKPDLVTLDVEMPVMDGLEAMGEIRKEYPDLPVIMYSSLTEHGARVTLDALAAGAKDYVTKPANVGSVVAATCSIKEELIPKIKVFCSPAAEQQKTDSAARSISAPSSLPHSRQRIDMVTIAVSTGGPNALECLIPALPADFPVAVTIVQHMPPIFTKTLADRLSSLSKLPVQEAATGDIVSRGSVWIAPGGSHMQLIRKIAAVQVLIDQSPPVNSCRPAADILFPSVAKLFGPRTLAVVLTGMGEDGFRGSQAIHEAGGQVIAQDEESSVVWGMPGRVANAGLADAVVPLKDMAGEIVRRVQFGRLARPG